MKKLVTKIIYIFLLITLVPILLVNIIIMVKSFVSPDKVPDVFGYKPMIVLTGSMEPDISTGDLVFAKEVEPKTLKIGDVISYRDNEKTIVTHKIVSIEPVNGELIFKTRGIANNTDDKIEIKENMIEGVYVGKVEKLGTVLQFIQTPIGIVLVVMGIIIIAFLLIGLASGFQNKEDKKLKEEFEEFKKSKMKEQEDKE